MISYTIEILYLINRHSTACKVNGRRGHSRWVKHRVDGVPAVL